MIANLYYKMLLVSGKINNIYKPSSVLHLEIQNIADIEIYKIVMH